MDRFGAMEVLLAAVEQGSLSKASRKLGLPLATVSRKVAELEAHLSATLVIRSTKGLELTPAGRSYATAAEAILEQMIEAERTAAGEYTEPKGTLVVTAPVMFGRLHALPVVIGFLSVHPDVAADLVLTDRIAHFLDDHVDVALRVGDLPDSGLVASRLGAVKRVVCASPEYLAAHGNPSTPDDLARHRVISFESVSSPSSWSFRSVDVETRIPFRSRFSVNTVDAAIAAGLAGAGIIRAMSYQVVDHLRVGSLTRVLEDFEPQSLPVHLVYNKRNRLPLKLRTFIDFVAPRLRERLERAVL